MKLRVLRALGPLGTRATFATFATLAPVCLLPLAAVLAGCGSSTSVTPADITFPTEAFATVKSVSGAYSVEVRSAPSQPPEQGDDAVEYRVSMSSDAEPGSSSSEAADLAIDVVPWMPEMGHGSSTTPVVTSMGEGRYVVSDVDLFMAGLWQLRTTLHRAGAADDSVVPSFQVP